ncbi:hypothetical protein ACFX13_042509 [Malus domestica]
MGAQIFKTPTSNSHHALTFLLPVLLLIITNMQTTVATSSSSQTYKTYVKTVEFTVSKYLSYINSLLKVTMVWQCIYKQYTALTITIIPLSNLSIYIRNLTNF